MFIAGIDPGPMVGAVLIRPTRPTETLEIAQVTPGSLRMLLDEWHAWFKLTALAAERFVVGPRAGRSRTPSGGAAARTVLGDLEAWADSLGIDFVLRSASEVKPWATDARLAAAGLLEPTTGMRHARDGARHALFCACKTYGLPDPLSARAGAR